jgi:hypothetical protein
MSFATRIFAFTDEGLVDWQGSYEDFVERNGGEGGSGDRGRRSANPEGASALR